MIKASLSSQLSNEICSIEDTEEIFWLRESDDYQSKIKLGNALAKQYRFIEATAAYNQALNIRCDDPMLYVRLGGAWLTLRRFDEAMDAFNNALRLDITGKSAAFPLGVWYYLKEKYSESSEWFNKCLPCDDETAIAVIYWHSLCCLRLGIPCSLIKQYKREMKIGHHTAYRDAVSVFSGETMEEIAIDKLNYEKDALNYVITAYGIAVYLNAKGENKAKEELLTKLLRRKSVWPCISYLAAWNDRLNNIE